MAKSEVTGADAEAQMLAKWNATDHAFDESRRVHEIIEDQAKRTPDAIALVFENERVSYRDFDADANRLANELQRRGVGRGAIVAVCMERSIELLVALLGVLKAGAAYAPLDPTHPPARLRMLVDDLSTNVVLTNATTSGSFAETNKTLVVDRAALQTSPASKPTVPLDDADLAYIIYTSGSTGTPKGVMSTHRGMRNRLLWGQSKYPIGPADAVLQKTPYTFDVSVWELFWPLIVGARLVIAKPEGHKDPKYVARTLREQGVTLTHFVPSMLALFLESYQVGSTPSLRRVVCSGEALPRAMQDRFFETVGCELVNLYGPTEASIEVSFWTCNPNDPPGEVPIGWPIYNTQLWVVDPALKPVAVGAEGELMIAGVGVARGYWNRPELTAEKFVPDPFSKEPGARMYRTGDLTRWRADGAIDYLGRIDHQVKIRGLRVELGEIEAALSACAGVSTAVVVARELANNDKQLVAYLVAKEGSVLDAEPLERELHRTLPAYMVPSVFVELPSFPLTSSGKVDRKALPAPPRATTSADAAGSESAGADALERVVAQTFGDVLGVSSVGLDDPFTAIGGSSLTAVRVLARLDAALRVSLAFTALYEFPTVRKLAAELRRRGATAPDAAARAPTASIPRVQTRDGWLQISNYQFPFWFTEQVMPGVNFAAFRIELQRGRRLDLVAMQRAFDAVVSRNEILRSTYGMVKGKPMQRIEPAGKSQPIAHTDLRGKAPADKAAEVARIERAVITDRFDLKRGPLLRMHLVTLDDGEHVIFGCGHHVAWDAHSSIKLGHELSVFYDAYERGLPIDLPPMRVQYADYSDYQRGRIEAGEGAKAVDYWQKRLAGTRPLSLPTDRPRRAKGSYEAGAAIAWSVDETVSTKLRELAVENGTTIFNVLGAGIALTLARCSGSTDVVLGATVSTRDRAELDALLGCFVNILPLRVDVHTPDVRELLGRMRTATTEALSNNVPFDLITERVGRTSEVGRGNVYDVLLVGQSDAIQSPSDMFRVHRIEAISTTLDRDLQFQVEQLAESIHGWTQYRTELYDRSTVEKINDDLVAVLKSLASREMPAR